MRQGLAFLAVLVGGGLVLSGHGQAIAAASLPAISAPVTAPALIEQAGYWKRRWRKGYYGPDVVIPDAGADVEIEAGGDVDVEIDAPAVIVLPPPRPLSCGEYRYWNGERCVDARYHNPYVGPR